MRTSTASTQLVSATRPRLAVPGAVRGLKRLAALIFFTLALPSHVAAELEACNQSPFVLNVAVGFHEAGTWRSRGWYNISPGGCAVVVGGDLNNRYYYVRAEDTSNRNVWGNNAEFCTRPEAFTLEDGNCSARGFASEKFNKVDVGNATSHTVNLVCDGCVQLSDWKLATSLPSVSHSFSVAGYSVGISATGTLNVDFTGSALLANVVLYGDLSDFQRKAGDIIRAQVNHNDDCNYILNVHTINLSPSGNSLRVYAAGHYEDWECPVIDLGPLGEIDGGKHLLFQQDGDIVAVLTPQTDGNRVWMGVEVTGMEADGIFGAILSSDWIGPYVRDLILQSIPQVLQVGAIRDLLPPSLRSFPLRLNNLAFYDRGNGALGLRVNATVTVSPQYAETVWNALQ